MAILGFLEFARDEGDEVVHVGFVLEPVEPGEAGFFFGFRQLLAVREGDHAFGHAAGNFGGELLDGMIEAREPVARFSRFSLRPQVVGGVAHFLGAEVESATGFRFVINAYVGFFADGNRRVEGEDDFGVGEVVSKTGFGASGAKDVEFNGVETKLGQWGCDGFESQHHVSLDGAFFEVGGDVEFEVEDVDFAVGRVFAVGG